MPIPLECEIIIADNASQLSERGADMFFRTARESVDLRGRFAVALSGGSTPRAMHKILAEEPYCSGISWDKVHIFWVDERCVPVSNPASNYGLAKQDFLDRISIPLGQIHPMPGKILPEKGTVLYQRELEAFFKPEQGDQPLFDLIFLGVGKDGHTASLFPGQQVLEECEEWVAAVKGGDPDVNRLTLTVPVLNNARQIVFLVSGKGKAPIVKSLFENSEPHLPAQKIQPIDGKLIWLLDKGAASLLSGEIAREAS